MSSPPTEAQLEVCRRFGADPLASRPELKVGIALNVREEGLEPLNGLRHPPEGDTTGWYIWAGELDPSAQGDDFFVPLHVEHLDGWCPAALPYLALPPGWRFLLAPAHEDAWFDAGVLET